jgi:Flp pilus assembly protein TadG
MAMSELVLVFIPFIAVLTITLQLAGASIAKVTVEYAAFTAARAAVVWLPREEAGSGGDIRDAAALPLIALSPGNADDAGGRATLSGQFGEGTGKSALSRKAEYARRATAVRWTPERPRWNDQVRVEVAYLYPCHVPLGRELVCKRFGSLPGVAGWGFRGSFPGYYVLITAEHTLTNQGRPGRDG